MISATKQPASYCIAERLTFQLANCQIKSRWQKGLANEYLGHKDTNDRLKFGWFKFDEPCTITKFSPNFPAA